MAIKPKYGGIEETYSDMKRMADENFNSFNNIEKSEILKHLKNKSQSIINSKRRFDEISDLETYMRVLENRDILNSRNISEIVDIYNLMGMNHDILVAHAQQVLDFERRLSSSPKLTTCETIGDHKHQKNNVNGSNLHRNTDSLKLNNLLANQPKNQGTLPVEASQIGKSWKSLARYLKEVPESLIDSIEANQAICSNEMQAKLILAEYEQNIHPSEKRKRLKKALRLVGRMDILDQVEKIYPLA